MLPARSRPTLRLGFVGIVIRTSFVRRPGWPSAVGALERRGPASAEPGFFFLYLRLPLRVSVSCSRGGPSSIRVRLDEARPCTFWARRLLPPCPYTVWVARRSSPYPSPFWIHPGPPRQGLGSGVPYGRCSEEQVARISVPASTGGTNPKYILGILFVGRAVSMFVLDASRFPVSRPRKRCSVWALFRRAGRPDIRPCLTGETIPMCVLGISFALVLGFLVNFFAQLPVRRAPQPRVSSVLFPTNEGGLAPTPFRSGSSWSSVPLSGSQGVFGRVY